MATENTEIKQTVDAEGDITMTAVHTAPTGKAPPPPQGPSAAAFQAAAAQNPGRPRSDEGFVSIKSPLPKAAVVRTFNVTIDRIGTPGLFCAEGFQGVKKGDTVTGISGITSATVVRVAANVITIDQVVNIFFSGNITVSSS